MLPENWKAYQVFEACMTQWRIAPSGQYQGIDYPAMESVMRLMAVKKPGKLFRKVQDFEMGALQEFRNSGTKSPGRRKGSPS